MSIFDLFRRRSRRQLRARYEAATNSRNMARLSLMTDRRSPNRSASSDVRARLRELARYEMENNSLVRGSILTIANWLVGTGPRLQVLGIDVEDRQRVERVFARWSSAINLPARLRIMRTAMATDGESFSLLVTNPALRHPVKLDVTVIESEMVAGTLYGDASGDDGDGIRYDSYGNPTAYRVLRVHPGEEVLSVALAEADWYPARYVVHYFREGRPGQRRGVSELAPCIPTLMQLRRYDQAVLDASEMAASFPLAIETDQPPGYETEPLDPSERQTEYMLDRFAATVLPANSKLSQVKAEYPTDNIGQFHDLLVSTCFRALLLPRNVVTGDSSDFNFASGRLDTQGYHRAIDVDRGDLVNRVLDPIFRAFIAEAVLIPGLLPESVESVGARAVDIEHEWFWDGFEPLDPAKAASANHTRLATGQTSLREIHAAAGLDTESLQESAAQSLGMTVEEYRRRVADEIFSRTATQSSQSIPQEEEA